MNALSQYLKKDKSSGSMLYSIPKKDLDSIDFKTFPVDLSGDITKKLAINNGVGTVAISNDNIQIVFVDATIQDIAKALKKQNISITDTPNNELLVILDEGGGHFKAVLQNSTHHIIHNFYPGTPLFLDSSDDDEEDDDDDSSDVLMSSLELLMLPIILYLPSSCKLASKNSGTQIYNGTFARPNNYKMPKDSLFVKHDGSYVVRFKVSDTEFYKVQETILDIDNQCKTKTLLYSPIPDEIQTENCFTSINRLVKAANIQTPYMQYFFDYQLKKAGEVEDLHFYHYKHDELSLAEKSYDIAEHGSSYIYSGITKLAILGSAFFATNFFMPGYGMAATVGLASYLFNNPSASDNKDVIVSSSVSTDVNFEILPCGTNNWIKQQCLINTNPFDMCVKDYGIEYPVSLDNNGIFQRTIVQNVWKEGDYTHSSFSKPENKSYCIEHHVVKYYNEMQGLIDDFNNNTQDFLS